MVIQHNMAALFTNRQLGVNNKSKAQAAERLGSGYKINRAADNAAGLTISEEMRAQIRGLDRAAQNVQEGINFCNVADGALNEVHNILSRIRELAVQAANDTNTSTDRDTINDEVKQLKNEINSISRNTEYNTYHIFSRPYELTFGGEPIIVGVFDANDGNPADPDSYGGIIVNGDTRVAWSAIDPDMTYTDPESGLTMFKKGSYQYDTGPCVLTIECEEGSKPPAIKVDIPVTASAAGISLAGADISLWDVLDEEDKPIAAAGLVKPGLYHFNYGGMEVSFTIPEGDTLEDVIDGITNGNQYFGRRYTNVYDGYYRAQAVDIIDTGSRMRITNSMFPQIKKHDDLDFKLQADTTGIWVLDEAGHVVADSKRSWEDLGISSWDSMNDISNNKRYEYYFENADYKISFDFTLLRETSLESVISGINNAAVQDTSIMASNETRYLFNPAGAGSGVVSGKLISANNSLTIYEEAALGRDFDVKKESLGEGQLLYDSTKNQFFVSWDNTEGAPQLEYTSINLSAIDTIKANANEYIQYLTARRIQSLLSGDEFSEKTLTDILGADKITTAGYMDGTVTIDKGVMNTTGDINNGTYPTAQIDFSGLGTAYQMYDLLGTGFNSTCKTCDNHYSVMFVYGGTEKITSQGYGYTLSNDGNQNYSLQIDLKSMMEKGIATGGDFTGDLVDIMRESGYDFHFTQYASSGSTLYICDNRPQNNGATEATFDTEPYKVDKATINMTLKNTSDNRNMTFQFEYDISKDLDTTAVMKVASSGEWVKDASGGYKKYVASDYHEENGDWKPGVTEAPTRYDIDITNNISSWDAYYDDIMNDIASGSKLELATTDYAYANYAANENPNSAVVSTFDFKIEEKGGFWIQAGANQGDGMAMTWDGFNTYSLGIGSGGTSTREAASGLISDAEKASEKISQLRSRFGAYVNRMEHMYSIAQNTSENLQYAESRIRDTDMAEEMVRFSKNDILAQAAQAMLTQANQSTRGVIMLLQ